MPRRSVQTVLVLAIACAPAHAQREAAGSLARALGVWSATDLDRDGRITGVEAASIPIDTAGFRREDADGDGAWSREEFLLFYRRCILASREPVGADLEAEVVRLQALKKARAIEETRQRTAVHAVGTGDLTIAAALAQLECRLEQRSAQRDDVARLRKLIHAKSPARTSSGVTEPARVRALAAIDPSAEPDALLDRIERAIVRGEDAPAQRASLRALLVQRGWIASAPAQVRLEQKADSSRSTPPSGPRRLSEPVRTP